MKERGADGSRIGTVRPGLGVESPCAYAEAEVPMASTSQCKTQLPSGDTESHEIVLQPLDCGSEMLCMSSSSGSGSGFAGFSSAGRTPHASSVTDTLSRGCVVILDTSARLEHKACPLGPRFEEIGNNSQKCVGDAVSPAAVTEMDVEVDAVQQKLQQRSSVNSVRGSAANDADLEVQQMTPMKRRKQRQRENNTNVTPSDELTNAPNLQTPPDQIVEINSISTTKSQKRRRLRRNTKLQLKLHRNQSTTNAIQNKCSTESTSEFPVSSPSNPQARGRKFPQRPALLKNTLPADALERNLALITAQRPQMTLEEKIKAWRCDDEPSDVEDVYDFDDLFKRHEELKRSAMKAIKRDSPNADIELQSSSYDFTEFRNMMRQFSNAKHVPRDSNDMKNHPKADKPTTSAEAAYLVAQRRLKLAIDNENKKRISKDRLKGKNSGLLPATSSSENEGGCHKGAGKQKHAKYSAAQKMPQQKILVYEKVLCPSSSEEASQDAVAVQHLRTLGGAAMLPTQAKTRAHSPPLHPPKTSTDNNSVFMLHRRHREIDKGHTEAPGLIQMRLDFGSGKKDLHLQEKKNELFKTPTVPQKYLTTPLAPIANNNNNIINGNDDSVEGEHNGRFNSSVKSEAAHCKMISHHGAATAPVATFGAAPSNATAAFHKQHEFCNYLGLTGMSTANAVANAVAELAKCKLARRSLRVRHLQQQGNKSKTEQGQEAKEEKMLEELKLKQLREVNRREKGGKDDSSHRITPSSCPSKLNNNNTANAVIKKLTLPKKEPEIKILCHISAGADRDEAEKVSKDCVKEITAPIRETLMRHLKHGVDSSYGTSTCPRSSLSEVDDGDETSSNPTPKPTQICKQKTPPSRTEPEPPNAAISPKKTDCGELVQMLHTKFQRYLEASRKTKPSIFIVQSMQSMNNDQSATEAKMNKPGIEEVDAPDKTSSLLTKRQRDKKQERNMLRSLQGKLQKRLLLRGRKTKERLHKLLTRSTWNVGHQRQLRNRKIVMVKTIKRSRKSKANKSTQKSESVTSEHSISSIASLRDKSLKDAKIHSSEVSEAGSRNQSKSSKSHKKSPPSCHSQGSTKQKHKNKRNTRVNSISSKADETKGNELKTTQTEVLATATNSVIIDASVRLSAGKHLESLGNDNEMVVVSSTTNNFDADTAQVPLEATKEVSNNASFVITTKENSTQSTVSGDGIHYLSRPSRALPNPIKRDQGAVDYIYYEMDVLIVVQTDLVSFWKYSKLIRVLSTPQSAPQKYEQLLHLPYYKPVLYAESSHSTAGAAHEASAPLTPGWTHLGQCRRINNDVEIHTTYANRICVHNSIPIYVEMRCRQVPRERRDCNLLSMYINVYFYNEDDMLAKAHSIQLDAVQSEPCNVVYTTITESRYFVMAWPQENQVGRTRSGLCKYSLTPHLDTLASIREFKEMRHELRYLECTDDDKLLGFGNTQLTIWDHRSGDVLMNYDLDVPLGRNLGSVYYPSLDIGQNNMLLLFQYVHQLGDDGKRRPELHIVVCCVSHAMPSYRLLKRHELPNDSFSTIRNAISTGEHLIIMATNDEEIWVSCADPDTITRVPAQGTRRFYARGRTQLIELTDKTLTVDSFANHVLKLAASKAKA